MLIRGMGEIVNLLWLFQEDRAELDAWKAADQKARLRNFGPAPVRRRLEALNKLGAPIDAERYGALCEIGTHPTPGLAPGHYSGSGRPVLGVILQEVGVFVCMNELAYTIAMASIPVVVLVGASDDIKAEIKEESVRLLEGIGSLNVLNYEEGLREAKRRAASAETT